MVIGFKNPYKRDGEDSGYFTLSGLRMDDYQTQTQSTAMYPDFVKVLYPLLGLAGEVGEVVEKVLDAIFTEEPKAESDEALIYNSLKSIVKKTRACETLKKSVRKGLYSEEQLGKLSELAKRLTQEQKDAIMDEVSDVLWYVADVLYDLDYKMSDCAQHNMDKLAKRKAEKTLHDRK